MLNAGAPAEDHEHITEARLSLANERGGARTCLNVVHPHRTRAQEVLPEGLSRCRNLGLRLFGSNDKDRRLISYLPRRPPTSDRNVSSFEGSPVEDQRSSPICRIIASRLFSRCEHQPIPPLQ